MGKNKKNHEKTTNQAGATQNMGQERNVNKGAERPGGQNPK